MRSRSRMDMKRPSLALFSFLLLFIVMFSGIPSPAQNRIDIPSYQDPGSPQWNEWRALGSSSVGIMIVNLNNGDDTTTGPHSFLDAGVNLIELDAKALAQTHALDYQIRPLTPTEPRCLPACSYP